MDHFTNITNILPPTATSNTPINKKKYQEWFNPQTEESNAKKPKTEHPQTITSNKIDYNDPQTRNISFNNKTAETHSVKEDMHCELRPDNLNKPNILNRLKNIRLSCLQVIIKHTENNTTEHLMNRIINLLTILNDNNNLDFIELDISKFQFKNDELQQIINNLPDKTRKLNLSIHYSDMSQEIVSTTINKLRLSCLQLTITPPKGEEDTECSAALMTGFLNTLSSNKNIQSIELNISGFWFENNELHEIANELPANITTLNLSKNKLTSIPEAFQNLSNLNELILWENSLENLHENMLIGLDNLRVLNLRFNPLAKIPSNALKSESLTTLILSKNYVLTTIESNAFEGLVNLTELDLTENEDLPNITPDILTGTPLYAKYKDQNSIDVSEQALKIE